MNKEFNKLIEIQEEFSKEFRDILLCDVMFDRALDFVSKVHKKSIEYERERILKDIEKFHKIQWKTNHNMVVNISLVTLIDYLKCVDIESKS